VTSFVKALLLAAFIGAAVWVGAADRAHTATISIPFAPIGFLAYVGAYQLIAGAYAGWSAPLYFAEENVAPSHSIPRALFIGIVITGALYVFVNAALLFALGTGGTAASDLPFAAILRQVGGVSVSTVFIIGAMVTVTSCANANIMVAPRILFAMARDRVLPELLLSINEGGSPYLGFALTAVISLALATTGAFRTVFGLVGTLNALSGVITDLSFFSLRKREPALPRPFRALLAPWLPALLVVIDGGLFVLFAVSDLKGAIVAAIMCALCVPLALVAHRARVRVPA